MSHVKDNDEKWAMALLQKIIDRSNADRDALSGKAVQHVKRARLILAKRQARKRKKRHRQSPADCSRSSITQTPMELFFINSNQV